MGEVKSLVDELDTVNGAMTVDLSCANCLQLMNDPVTFIPCGHTLYRVCAYKYGKQGKTQCPTCSDAANTTRGYVRNFIVESLCTREAVKRQRMDEIRSSSGSLMVTQALLEVRMRKLPQARMILDSFDEEIANGQNLPLKPSNGGTLGLQHRSHSLSSVSPPTRMSCGSKYLRNFTAFASTESSIANCIGVLSGS